MPDQLTIMLHLSEYLREFYPQGDWQDLYEMLQHALEAPHKYRDELADAEHWVAAGRPSEWPHLWKPRCGGCGALINDMNKAGDIDGHDACEKCIADYIATARAPRIVAAKCRVEGRYA